MRKNTAFRLALLALSTTFFAAACGDDSEGGDGTTGATGGGGGSGGGGNGGTTSGTGSGGTSSGRGGSGGAPSGGASASGGANPSGGAGGSSGSTEGGSGGAMTGGTGTGGGSGAGGSGGSGGVPMTGPDCTRSFAASATFSQVQTAINGAAAGDVICLERGATWSGSLNVNNAAPTATERVLVCASAPGGTECSTAGGPNPILRASVTFNQNADGFVFRNLDFVCASGCGDAIAVDLAGASHIRFEGGVVRDWAQAFMCNSFSTDEPCDDIEIGGIGLPTEITNVTNGFFGWLSNSYVRINAHDNGDGTVYTHHFYLSSGPQNSPSVNVVFEGGYYTRSSVAGGLSLGTFLNLSGQNKDIIIRDNVFEDDACSTYMIDCGSGGEDPEEFCDGMQIYGNTFKTNCPLVMSLVSTQRARIFNNVFMASGQLVSMEDGERPAADGWVFNNTIVCPGGCEQAFAFTSNDNRFFNNLLYYPSGGSILPSNACARFGGGTGPNFTNNFLYAPGNSPRLPNCGSMNSTSFSTEPGFADAADEDFHITEASAAAGFGTAENAPRDDFDRVARPSPPSAGAFDVH
jgi:hypothetical protein